MSDNFVVLFAHQSAELYGSDRVLLNIVTGLDRTRFDALVLLPEDGPLCEKLRAVGVETHVFPLGKISRKSFSPFGMIRLLIELARSNWAIWRLLRGRKIDLVYSNTLAIFGPAIFAKWAGLKHLWHVHEIIAKPRFVSRAFAFALKHLSNDIICNSGMTKAWLDGEISTQYPSRVVIWNGMPERPPICADKVRDFRRSLGLGDGDLLVSLVGRISNWKGQDVLVSAAALLWDRGVRNVKYLVLGSAVQNESGFRLEKEFDQLSARSSASDVIRRLPFTEDVWTAWDASDIAVVPSKEPEPFGLVAIEAMASGLPVVAANHGGLVEIVDDGVTGILVKPSDAGALADAVALLVDDPERRLEMGLAAKERQRSMFGVAEQIDRTVLEMLAVMNRGS